jgi:hypothetical protein
MGMGRLADARRGHGRTIWLSLALALAVPAFAGAAVIPDVSNAPAGAQAIESLPDRASEAIETPGDQDWYSIVGRNADDSVNAVFVRVLQTTPSCSQPLKIALFNPEGNWIRSTQASAGHVATVLVPRLPSRYSIDVSAIEPGCTGVEYEVTSVSTDPPTPDSAAGACLVARARVIDREDWLKMLKKHGQGISAPAQKRYDVYIAAAKHSLSRARASEKRACK